MATPRKFTELKEQQANVQGAVQPAPTIAVTPKAKPRTPTKQPVQKVQEVPTQNFILVETLDQEQLEERDTERLKNTFRAGREQQQTPQPRTNTPNAIAVGSTPTTTQSQIPRQEIRQAHPDYYTHLQEEQSFFSPPKQTAAKPYNQTAVRRTTAPQQQIRLVTRSGNGQQPQATRTRQNESNPQTHHRTRAKVSLSMIVTGIGLTAIALIAIGMYLALTVPTAYTRWSDNNTYGFPHKYEQSVNVGHGGVSDIVIENLNGTIKIHEELIVPPNQDPKPHLYIVTTLPGSDAKYIVVTFSFVAGQHPGKPDMLISFSGYTIRYYNNGATFQSHP